MAQGSPADAAPDLRHAVDVDQAHGDNHGTALHRHLLGQALMGSGHHRDALVELHLAAVALAEIGDRVAGARVLTTMGAVHRRDGDTARTYYRAAAQHYRLGWPDGHAVWADTEAASTS